eukprot:4708702-Pleurochrysis_carterae.AAC.1
MFFQQSFLIRKCFAIVVLHLKKALCRPLSLAVIAVGNVSCEHRIRFHPRISSHVLMQILQAPAASPFSTFTLDNRTRESKQDLQTLPPIADAQASFWA